MKTNEQEYKLLLFSLGMMRLQRDLTIKTFLYKKWTYKKN